MATKRGLNKGKGLGALLPQKLKETEAPEAAAEEVVSNVSTSEVSVEKPAKAAKKTPAKTTAAKKTATKASAAKTPKATEVKKEDIDAVEGARVIRLADIIPNQGQPRKVFDKETIEELAQSIKNHGLLQPILVQKKGKYYEIVAGERRWRAAREAGLKEVPVIVREFSDQEGMEIALIENIQREDLNAIEEAEAYKKLIEEFELTQDEVAKKVGKSRTAVTNALRLLKLAAPVRHLLVKGDITMGHARALLALEDGEMQVSAAHQIIQKKLSVRETEKLVKALINPRKPREKKEPDQQLMAAYKDLETQMQKKMGTKVSIHTNEDGNKGKIEIEYYSQEDLERIIDILG